MNKFQVTGTPYAGGTITLAVGAASAAASPGSGEVVRLLATVDCFVAFGDTPTADTTTSMLLPAGVPEYFFLPLGQKVAAIQSAEAGSLYITPME